MNAPLRPETLPEWRLDDPRIEADLAEAVAANNELVGLKGQFVGALKPFGLNPREKAFWAAGCRQLERLVDEFEELAG